MGNDKYLIFAFRRFKLHLENQPKKKRQKWQSIDCTFDNQFVDFKNCYQIDRCVIDSCVAIFATGWIIEETAVVLERATLATEEVFAVRQEINQQFYTSFWLFCFLKIGLLQPHTKRCF